MIAEKKSIRVLNELDKSPRLPERSPPVTSMTARKAPASIPFLAADSLVPKSDISNKQNKHYIPPKTFLLEESEALVVRLTILQPHAHVIGQLHWK